MCSCTCIFLWEILVKMDQNITETHNCIWGYSKRCFIIKIIWKEIRSLEVIWTEFTGRAALWIFLKYYKVYQSILHVSIQANWDLMKYGIYSAFVCIQETVYQWIKLEYSRAFQEKKLDHIFAAQVFPLNLK